MGSQQADNRGSRLSIAITAILLGGGAGALGGALATNSVPDDPVFNAELAGVRADLAAQKSAAHGALATGIHLTLSGEVDLRGGGAYSGELYLQVGPRGNPAGGVSSILEGVADVNGAFSLTGEVHGVALGDMVEVRLFTSKKALEGPAVFSVASQALRATRALQVARDLGAAGIGATVGKIRLLPPVPIAEVYVAGDPGISHIVNIRPALETPGTPKEFFDLSLPGLQVTPIFSWFPTDDWLLGGEVDGVQVHRREFRRGDSIVAEPVVLVHATGLVDTQIIPSGADVVFFAEANYESAGDAGVRTLADLVYRNFVANKGWQADAVVEADGQIGPVTLVPGLYVVEVWPSVSSNDDFTVPAPNLLATKSLYIDSSTSTFTLP